MPLVPMDIASDIVMVPNVTAFPPFSLMPLAACSASSWMCMLHGVRSLHVLATPICGLVKSSSEKPVALSMERAGARSTPSTIWEEFGRGIFAIGKMDDIRWEAQYKWGGQIAAQGSWNVSLLGSGCRTVSFQTSQLLNHSRVSR